MHLQSKQKSKKCKKEGSLILDTNSKIMLPLYLKFLNMCESNDGLKDVGLEKFWDTTGVVSSGEIDGVEYVFHEQPAENLQPQSEKICLRSVVKNSPILGDVCFKCGMNVYFRKKANLNSTH